MEQEKKKKFYQTWQFFVLSLVVIIGVFITINTSGIMDREAEAETLEEHTEEDVEYVLEVMRLVSELDKGMDSYTEKLGEGLNNPSLLQTNDFKIDLVSTLHSFNELLDNVINLDAPEKYSEVDKNFTEAAEYYKNIPEKMPKAIDDMDANLMDEINEETEKGGKSLEKVVEAMKDVSDKIKK